MFSLFTVPAFASTSDTMNVSEVEIGEQSNAGVQPMGVLHPREFTKSRNVSRTYPLYVRIYGSTPISNMLAI